MDGPKSFMPYFVTLGGLIDRILILYPCKSRYSGRTSAGKEAHSG